jgi:tRNA (cytidine56-2'-O)-methyltransferase
MHKPIVSVLRVGHRLVRDQRINTHVALVTRAFGGSNLYFSGKDEQVEKTVSEVTSIWGGNFHVEFVPDWKNFVKNWKIGFENNLIIHLTMYGEPLDESIDRILGKDPSKILIIVGSQKVPPEVFHLSDHNVAVGSQPHSEIAAIAVFLDRLFKGEELKRAFEGAKLKILPSKHGKIVQRIKEFED